MGGVADDGLVQVADLDGQRAVGTGDGPEVADMAVAADPDGRTGGDRVAVGGFEPLIKAVGASADVGVGGGRHFQVAPGGQALRSVVWIGDGGACH